MSNTKDRADMGETIREQAPVVNPDGDSQIRAASPTADAPVLLKDQVMSSDPLPIAEHPAVNAGAPTDKAEHPAVLNDDSAANQAHTLSTFEGAVSSAQRCKVSQDNTESILQFTAPHAPVSQAMKNAESLSQYLRVDSAISEAMKNAESLSQHLRVDSAISEAIKVGFEPLSQHLRVDSAISEAIKVGFEPLSHHLRVDSAISEAIKVGFEPLSQHLRVDSAISEAIKVGFEPLFEAAAPRFTEISDVLRTAYMTTGITSVTEAFRLTLSAAVTPVFNDLHHSWGRLAPHLKEADKPPWLHTADFAQLTELTSNMMGTLATFAGDVSPYLTRIQEQRLDTRLAAVATAYSKFLEAPRAVIKNVPKEIAALPPIEVFAATALFESVSLPAAPVPPPEQQLRDIITVRTSGRLEELLHSLGPELIPMWQGAHHSFNSDNPDRARHVATSLRELFTHVLHRLAPDGAVKQWSQNPKQHFHEGRPTRRGRLLYISREINQGVFHDFVERDVEAVVEFINLFQRGTHEAPVAFNESQLRLLITKMEGVLTLLLECSCIH